MSDASFTTCWHWIVLPCASEELTKHLSLCSLCLLLSLFVCLCICLSLSPPIPNLRLPFHLSIYLSQFIYLLTPSFLFISLSLSIYNLFFLLIPLLYPADKKFSGFLPLSQYVLASRDLPPTTPNPLLSPSLSLSLSLSLCLSLFFISLSLCLLLVQEVLFYSLVFHSSDTSSDWGTN